MRRALYEQHCAACHGPNGDGNPLGGARAPSLRSEHARGQTDEALFNWVKRGGSNMPSFKQALTDEQIRELVRYLREEIQEQSVAGAIARHEGASEKQKLTTG